MGFCKQEPYNGSNVNSFPMRSAAKFHLPLLLAPAFLPGSAHALITCSAPLNSCSGTDNNVIFSNFSFSGFTPNPSDTISLSGNPDGSGTVILLFNPFRNTPTVGSFTYTATLIPTPLFIFSFKNANVDSASTLSPGRTVTTSLYSSGLSTPASYSKTGGVTSPQVTGIFLPQLTSQTFTQVFNLNPAPTDFVITVTNNWTTNSSPVPSPLPLLGAATAFGRSRKLRRRIRSAA